MSETTREAKPHCTCEVGMGSYPGDHHEKGCQLNPVEPAPINTTHPVGRRSVPGIHHADDCPMRHGFVTTGCFCGREGERTSGVTDAAVNAATGVYGGPSGRMRAALEAAHPHLAPQPEVDREALEKAVTGLFVESEAGQHRLSANDASNITDAVLALLTGSAK